MTSAVKGWASSALAGLGALGLMRCLAPWLGFTVAVGPPSLGVAAVLGLPGVAALLFLRVLFAA